MCFDDDNDKWGFLFSIQLNVPYIITVDCVIAKRCGLHYCVAIYLKFLLDTVPDSFQR